MWKLVFQSSNWGVTQRNDDSERNEDVTPKHNFTTSIFVKGRNCFKSFGLQNERIRNLEKKLAFQHCVMTFTQNFKFGHFTFVSQEKSNVYVKIKRRERTCEVCSMCRIHCFSHEICRILTFSLPMPSSLRKVPNIIVTPQLDILNFNFRILKTATVK